MSHRLRRSRNPDLKTHHPRKGRYDWARIARINKLAPGMCSWVELLMEHLNQDSAALICLLGELFDFESIGGDGLFQKNKFPSG